MDHHNESSNTKGIPGSRAKQSFWADPRRRHHRHLSTGNVKDHRNIPSLKLTARSPLKIGRNPRGKDHLPIIQIQGRAVTFREGNIKHIEKVQYLNKIISDLANVYGCDSLPFLRKRIPNRNGDSFFWNAPKPTNLQNGGLFWGTLKIQAGKNPNLSRKSIEKKHPKLNYKCLDSPHPIFSCIRVTLLRISISIVTLCAKR